jgi:hypothetical protein
MPRFVTPILHARHARYAASVRAVPPAASPGDSPGYRRRLADLRTRAPDTLRARVRRELREAAASAAAPSARAE